MSSEKMTSSEGMMSSGTVEPLELCSIVKEERHNDIMTFRKRILIGLGTMDQSEAWDAQACRW